MAETVIRPRKGWIAVDWQELWGHRELLFFLVWRDVKVRYKQAVLGFAWAILAPLIMVGIFTVVFGKAGGMAKDLPLGIPFSVYIFAGLIPWLMISQAIGAGGLSLVTQQNLLSKIYLPRLFIPAATIGSSLVDMCISATVFSLMMLGLGIMPAWTIVFVPLLVLVTIIMALGFALTLSSLTVTFRDLRFLIPFIVQLFMLVSAVAYPSKVLRAYPYLLYTNPIAGLISTYRAAIFRGGAVGWSAWHFAYSVAFAIALFIFGLFYFRRTERRFADIA